MPDKRSVSSRWRGGLIAGFALLIAVRLLIAWQLPITDDEAYYWIWSQHLSWGYPDHPPMIALLIRISTAAFGDQPPGIRLGALTLTVATGAIVYALGKDMFGPKIAVVAALTSQLLPMVATGGAVAVPDAPFIFFWMLTICLFWRARSTGAAFYWYAAGAALGLTMMSKLFGVLLALGLAGYVMATPAERKWLARPHTYGAIVIAMAIVAPLTWWNFTQGWPSLAKIAHQDFWIRIGPWWYKTVAYAAAQFAYYGPVSAPLLFAALRASVQRRQIEDWRFALLAWTALPIFVLPFALSPGGVPKPHWPAPAYLLASIAAAALWLEHGRPLMRTVLVAAFGVNVLIVAIILMQPWIAPAAFDQLRGWEQVTAQAEAIAATLPPRPGVFIFSGGYQTASQLTYRLRGRYPVTAGSTDTALARIVPLRQFIGWNAVYLDDDREPTRIPLDRMFRILEPLPRIKVNIDGRVPRRYVVFRGIDFRGHQRR